MCVIIVKPKNESLPEKDIRTAYENNPHGFGYVYYDKETKRLKHDKGISFSVDAVLALMAEQEHLDVIYHLRWATQGDTTDALCHPFEVTTKDKDGMDMVFMHNGVIHKHKKTKDESESDTSRFCEDMLIPLLGKKPSLMRLPSMQILLKEYIGCNSKLAFMFGRGEIGLVNEEKFTKRNGCLISNTEAFVKFSRFGDPSKKNKGTTNRNVESASTGMDTATVNPLCGVNHKAGDFVTVVRATDEGKVEMYKGEVCGFRPTHDKKMIAVLKFKDPSVNKEVPLILSFCSITGISRQYKGIYGCIVENEAAYDITEKVGDTKKETLPSTGKVVDLLVEKKKKSNLPIEDKQTEPELLPNVEEMEYGGLSVSHLQSLSSRELAVFVQAYPTDAVDVLKDLLDVVILKDYALNEEDDEIEYYSYNEQIGRYM